MKNELYKYLLLLGDNSMILGQRLSELCGHGPNLETDIALTNISLDLFGQVRSLFQYAASINDSTEDDVAYLRSEREYYNCILVEHKNIDFAYVIARQFFYDAYHKPLLEQLINSADKTISAISAKSIKESKYHLRFSSEWMKRLGDGTAESHQKLQNAVNDLYPFCHEFFKETSVEKIMKENGVGADLTIVKESFDKTLDTVLSSSNIEFKDLDFRYANGKEGIHTEDFGFLLSDFQYIQRAYPNMSW